jgi:glycine/D-amino acid oxidase-like deaminating enzyme
LQGKTSQLSHKIAHFHKQSIMAGDEQKNIVIIGGGIIGATSAYFLTHHPSYNPEKHKVILLEATKIAGGASGKAGGP